MPGSNARALEKARTLPADVLVFDLEDAVAPEMKVEARAQVAATIKAGGYGHREIVVRVNALAALSAPPAVWCMLETPRGILNAPSIAAASPRVAALVMGTSDLTKDLHARHTRE